MAAPERWVCLDIGETLIDETRVWSTWAGVLGTTPLVLMAAMGAAIAGGRSHEDALEDLQPGWIDHAAAIEARYGGFRAVDLYPDALPGIAALSAAGFGVAVIGNQPTQRTAELRAIGVAPDVMVMSEVLGAEKPDAAFYDLALRAMGDPAPAAVTYVGDRVDNDVLPARAHGLGAIHLRRGPWAILGPQAGGQADAVVDDLAGVVRWLTRDTPR